MAITYKSVGAAFITEVSGASLQGNTPATVDAGDILIAHVVIESTSEVPATPNGGASPWVLLSGPHVIETTLARTWIFGRIGVGGEGGGAYDFGQNAVTSVRAVRMYSFAGRVSGAIADLVRGFAFLSHATDPQMPTVATTQTGALAVACVVQLDNNAQASPTGESGGDWVEAVAEALLTGNPDIGFGLQTCTPTGNPGTVTGGAMATVDDPCGVIGFEIRAAGPPTVTSATPDTGTTAGGTSVVLAGTGFLAGAAVTFGGTAATDVSVDSSIQITCTTPAHAAGAVNVVVTNTDTQAGTLTDGYTYQTPAGIAAMQAIPIFRRRRDD